MLHLIFFYNIFKNHFKTGQIMTESVPGFFCDNPYLIYIDKVYRMYHIVASLIYEKYGMYV